MIWLLKAGDYLCKYHCFLGVHKFTLNCFYRVNILITIYPLISGPGSDPSGTNELVMNHINYIRKKSFFPFNSNLFY